MQVQVNEDRSITKDAEVYGTQNENKATLMEFTFPEKYADFDKKIVFRGDNGSIVENIVDGEYYLKTNITQYSNIYMYVWLTNGDTTQDFRTKTYNVNFFKNAQATAEIPAATPISA